MQNDVKPIQTRAAIKRLFENLESVDDSEIIERYISSATTMIGQLVANTCSHKEQVDETLKKIMENIKYNAETVFEMIEKHNNQSENRNEK